MIGDSYPDYRIMAVGITGAVIRIRSGAGIDNVNTGMQLLQKQQELFIL